MTPEEAANDLADAVRASDALGPIILHMDTATVVNLIAVVQVAARHPTARYLHAVQQVVALVRQGQDGLARRDERLGRYLEQGWHEVFDTPPATEDQ